MKLVKGADERLLYLDFDGVLHHEAVICTRKRGIHVSPSEAPGRVLFEWLPLLEEAIEPYPALRLVLSTSWCVRPGYGKALKRLPAALRPRFLGGTFHRRVHGLAQADFRATPRWAQIFNDVQRRQPAGWLAVDDDVADWPARLRRHLVACEGDTGLSAPAALEELRSRLSGLFDSS
ncbi:HAD domain-containing protein [Rubrivivax gelatinosus]|uniref:HAD domain-containing protein n=1 Tax=Rubrivivax gelatinosus TaxID=28068 RepID=UPI001E4648DC|nr:HAD domain-containing protein [Rubrivivax gelatinosus]